MMFKSDVALSPEMTPTVAYYPVKFMTDMVSRMFDARLDEITAKPDAPFASAGGYYDGFFLAKTKDAFNVSAVAKGNDILPALEAAYRELRRATEGGFTVGEYERAKANTSHARKHATITAIPARTRNSSRNMYATSLTVTPYHLPKTNMR